MKTFDNLSKEEKVGLVTEQVQYYARLECANRGIVIPQKPISQVQVVTPPTKKYYVVGYDSFVFETEIDAQNYIDSKAKSFKIVSIGSDYNTKSQYIGTPTEDYKEIKTVILYTKEEAVELKDVLKANSEAVKEWDEYHKSLEEYNKIESYIWEDIEEINFRNSRISHYNKIYKDYLELAEGDEKTAYKFFSKAYSKLSLSDIDREIVDDILSTPTCEEILIP